MKSTLGCKLRCLFLGFLKFIALLILMQLRRLRRSHAGWAEPPLQVLFAQFRLLRPECDLATGSPQWVSGLVGVSRDFFAFMSYGARSLQPAAPTAARCSMKAIQDSVYWRTLPMDHR
jgi:hypothetical protein